MLLQPQDKYSQNLVGESETQKERSFSAARAQKHWHTSAGSLCW